MDILTKGGHSKNLMYQADTNDKGHWFVGFIPPWTPKGLRVIDGTHITWAQKRNKCVTGASRQIKPNCMNNMCETKKVKSQKQSRNVSFLFDFGLKISIGKKTWGSISEDSRHRKGRCVPRAADSEWEGRFWAIGLRGLGPCMCITSPHWQSCLILLERKTGRSHVTDLHSLI